MTDETKPLSEKYPHIEDDCVDPAVLRAALEEAARAIAERDRRIRRLGEEAADAANLTHKAFLERDRRIEEKGQEIRALNEMRLEAQEAEASLRSQLAAAQEDHRCSVEEERRLRALHQEAQAQLAAAQEEIERLRTANENNLAALDQNIAAVSRRQQRVEELEQQVIDARCDEDKARIAEQAMSAGLDAKDEVLDLRSRLVAAQEELKENEGVMQALRRREAEAREEIERLGGRIAELQGIEMAQDMILEEKRDLLEKLGEEVGRSDFNADGDLWEKLLRERDALSEHIGDLEQGLRRYGMHEIACAADDAPAECICGLDALLQKERQT